MASSVKFSGALYNNRHTFQIASAQLTNEAKTAVNRVAKMYHDSLMTMLGHGKDIWGIPDTAYYRKKKAYYLERHGLPDSGPWVKSGELMSHVTYEVSQNGSKRFRAWAGFEEGTHSSGYKISEMVNWLDNDYPLIEPAWTRIESRAMNILGEIGTGMFRNERGW